MQPNRMKIENLGQGQMSSQNQILSNNQPRQFGEPTGEQTLQPSENFTGEDRIKNMHSYEVNKYMQKDIRPIHMPKMVQFKRASDSDPGQSSPRA